MSESKINNIRVVVIGGGTGSFVMLSGIKKYIQNITALVSMADDGGSTGQLRDELGVLPPGDVRQCLVALSESPITRDLFNYRFEEGSFKGHAFGNIFLTALEKMTGNFAEAVEEAGRVLAITGNVEPITLDKVSLVIKTENGDVIKGQFEGSRSEFDGLAEPMISLDPEGVINPAAKQAIEEADLVVIAPGGLYTSIAPALIVNGVSEALQKTKAKKIYVCNLVTKPGQTDDFGVDDYAREIERFMGGSKLDYVIYNNVAPSEDLLNRYAHEGEYPVKWDETTLSNQHYKAKGLDLVSRDMWDGDSPSDPIGHVRTYIRHNPDKLARELMRIYFA